MKFPFLAALLLPILLSGQTQISGKVIDDDGQPVPFANVYLEEVYDGGSADESGLFSFRTEATGPVVLVVSNIGYTDYQTDLFLDGRPVELDVVLRSGVREMREVVVSVGAFEASDEKKGTVLKPLDIVTNPVAGADVFGALQSLPGVVPVGDQTGLFVRGGDASETKTIIDGALVAQPFLGDVPDIPARGRFDPFLFKGTLFSTGGYSAQYGQALSSVLILNTLDIPDNDEYSVNLNMAGLGGAFTKTWNDRTAVLGNLNYSNLGPLFAIVPQNRNWVTPPNGIDAAVGFRHKDQKNGLYKSYLQYQGGTIALNFDPNGNPSSNELFQNRNQNVFWNNSYRGILGKDWGLLAVAAFSYDRDTDELFTDRFGSREWLGQSRVTLSKAFGKFFTRIGTEMQLSESEHFFNDNESILSNTFTAMYAESDVTLSKNLAARIGWRTEYATVLDEWQVMPRVSLSYRTGKNAQLSMAYGQFYQIPETEFLRQSTELGSEKSTHYILNYQWQTEQRTLRIEGYLKDYTRLVRLPDAMRLENTGDGFARGIDVFWRDQKSIPNLMYWVSYSFIDAERLYRDFPTTATPHFVSNHTLTVLGNYMITPRLRLGAAYSYASGRPYLNPNNEAFLSDRLIDYHNLNISSSYLCNLFGNFTVVYASIRNPFQFRQVFGYRYSEDGLSREPVLPASDWSFFAGMSISFRN